MVVPDDEPRMCCVGGLEGRVTAMHGISCAEIIECLNAWPDLPDCTLAGRIFVNVVAQEYD
jgi:hypothetical protein